MAKLIKIVRVLRSPIVRLIHIFIFIQTYLLIIHVVLLLHQNWKSSTFLQNKKDSFAVKIVRDEKVTVTSFVANVGGLLGLCMGFSLVSVVEMVYFVIKEKIVVTCGSIFGKRKEKQRNASQDNEDGDTPKHGQDRIITSSL